MQILKRNDSHLKLYERKLNCILATISFRLEHLENPPAHFARQPTMEPHRPQDKTLPPERPQPSMEPHLPERKRQRLALPQLPDDVVVRIMHHTCVPVVNQSRQVCRCWRRAIDGHSTELWESFIKGLGLLPEEGNDTVLGRSADLLRSRSNKVRRDAKEKNTARKEEQLYSQY